MPMRNRRHEADHLGVNTATGDSNSVLPREAYKERPELRLEIQIDHSLCRPS